jgi:hypothetical protein
MYRTLAVLFVCLGLFSILFFHDFLYGSSQVVLGVALATDEVLLKQAVAKKWRILFKISVGIMFGIVFLSLFVPLFFRK